MMIPPPTNEEVEHRNETEEYGTFARDRDVEGYGRVLAVEPCAVVAEAAAGAVM